MKSQARRPENYKILQLANGAYSVRSLLHGETFHPVVGPVAEAEALYVRQLRIRERFAATKGGFVVWDVGLGAAANPITALRALDGLPGRIHIISFDQTVGPLAFALKHTGELDYLPGYEGPLSELVSSHRATIRHPHSPEVIWELHLGDFPTLLNAPALRTLPKPHVILYDAFSPAKNPAMWTLPVFASIHNLLDPRRPCALPTYSRSTMLRVTLLLAGFYVGVGHATGEKEETTIASNTPALIEEPLDRKWLLRARKSTSAEPLYDPIYRQAPLSEASWEALINHPQFA